MCRLRFQELCSNSGHGKEVDLWAMGVLLFEILNGVRPFVARKGPLKRPIRNGSNGSNGTTTFAVAVLLELGAERF